MAPWFVSMVGFVSGLPFLYQLAPRKRQLEAPKYLSPRTDTPMPIFNPEQKINYLRDFMVFFKPGDIIKWKPIDRETYDQTVADVEAGRFERSSRMSPSISTPSTATSMATMPA